MRRRHAHGQRRPERRQTAAVHHRALRGNRTDLGTVLRHAHHRRSHARRHARTARLAEDDARRAAAISAWSWRSSRATRPRSCFRSWTKALRRRDVRSRSKAMSILTASRTPMRNPRRSAARRSCATPASRISKQRPDGSWDVITDQGTVHAEHVVNAGGPVGARGRAAWSASSCPSSRWSINI